MSRDKPLGHLCDPTVHLCLTSSSWLSSWLVPCFDLGSAGSMWRDFCALKKLCLNWRNLQNQGLGHCVFWRCAWLTSQQYAKCFIPLMIHYHSNTSFIRQMAKTVKQNELCKTQVAAEFKQEMGCVPSTCTVIGELIQHTPAAKESSWQNMKRAGLREFRLLKCFQKG